MVDQFAASQHLTLGLFGLRINAVNLQSVLKCWLKVDIGERYICL